MKKSLFLIFVIFVFMGLLHSQIRITQPIAGQTVCKGSTLTITWNSVGIPTPNVKIRLRQGAVKVLDIHDSTRDDGTYYWPVPGSLANGSYFIRVASTDGAMIGDSPNFTITEAERPDFSVVELNLEARDNTHILYALIKNKGKSFAGPLEIKIVGMDKFFGHRKFSLIKTVTEQNFSIASGQKRWVIKHQINWPIDIPYITFKIQIDPENKILELNEKNNFSIQRTFLRKFTTKPDFSIVEIKYYRGKLTAIIINDGAYFSAPLEFRIIGMDKFPGGRFTLDKRVIKNVYRMDTGYKKIVKLCDIDWPHGVKNITFVVLIDPDNKVSEIKENNNSKEQVINSNK